MHRIATLIIAAAIALAGIVAIPSSAAAKPSGSDIVKVPSIPDPPKLPHRKRPPGPIVCPRPIPGHAVCWPAGGIRTAYAR